MLTMGLHRWWRRMGFDNIEKQRKQFAYKLEHVGLDLYAKMLADALAFSEDALKQVREAKEATEHEFRALWASWFRTPTPTRPRRVFYQGVIAVSTEIGGWAFVMLEGFLAAAFSVQFLRAQTGVAIAIGVVTTVVIALAMKGLVVPMLFGQYDEMPRAGLKPMLVTAGTMFVLEVLLIGILFFARSVSTDATDLAFRVAAAIISITTPVAAAVLFTLAALLGWSETLVMKWEWLSRLERQVQGQVNFCLARLASIATQLPIAPSAQTTTAKTS